METKKTLSFSGIDSFNTYISEHNISAKKDKVSDLYYHVNVVAEAYNAGFNSGEASAKNAFMDKIISKFSENFKEKANQIYLSSKAVASNLIKEGYSVDGIYINISLDKPKVILSVPDEQMLDNDFVEFVYTRIHEVQNSFYTLFNSSLDLSLVGSEYLDEDLLKCDGFGYSEKF